MIGQENISKVFFNDVKPINKEAQQHVWDLIALISQKFAYFCKKKDFSDS